MSLVLKTAHFCGRAIQLANEERINPRASSVTVIVGKNGAGKSRLLGSITQCFLDIERNRSSSKSSSGFKLEYIFEGRSHLIGSGRENLIIGRRIPNKVIAVSVSPFDKFPLTEPDIELFRARRRPTSIYAYLGARGRWPFSAQSQMLRVTDALIGATSKARRELHLLRGVFEFLNYKPRIRILYLLRVRDLERMRESDTESFRKHLERTHFTRASGWRDPRGVSDEELLEVIRAAKLLSDHLIIEGRKLVLDLNFEREHFPASILEIHAAISSLRRFRIISFSDCILSRSGMDEIRLREASSGEQAIVLTLLGIAGEIEENSLICIDEPELSLHPEWQERFIELLTKTFKNYAGCHFLLATHSPQIISRLPEENCAVVAIDEGITYPASEFIGRSADFQLAKLFKAPGHRNEFLMRKVASVVAQLGKTVRLEEKLQRDITELIELRHSLESGDVVAGLIDDVLAAVRDKL